MATMKEYIRSLFAMVGRLKAENARLKAEVEANRATWYRDREVGGRYIWQQIADAKASRQPEVEAIRELLKRCHPMVVHALCSIPDEMPEYIEASKLANEMSPVCWPEIHSLLTKHAALAQSPS